MTLNTLIDAASKLSQAERAELLDALLSLDGPEEPETPDFNLPPAQREDLRRRIEEYRAGKATMIPGDLAIEMVRKRE